MSTSNSKTPLPVKWVTCKFPPTLLSRFSMLNLNLVTFKLKVVIKTTVLLLVIVTYLALLNLEINLWIVWDQVTLDITTGKITWVA
jgi:hypothetical protein